MNSWEGGSKQQHPKSQTERDEPRLEKSKKNALFSLWLDRKRGKNVIDVIILMTC